MRINGHNESTSSSVQCGNEFPEFLPLPSPGKICPWSGCTRSYLNTLILPNVDNDFKPSVKSISIRKRGSVKGKRLVVGDSLRQFLWDHIDDGNLARERYETQPIKDRKKTFSRNCELKRSNREGIRTGRTGQK